MRKDTLLAEPFIHLLDLGVLVEHVLLVTRTQVWTKQGSTLCTWYSGLSYDLQVTIVQFRVRYDRYIKEVKTHFLQA